MNATAAICACFLKGNILSIKSAFKDIGITNLPREVGRSVERKFGVRISKMQRTGKSRYGTPVIWVDYRLNKDDPANQPGIARMKEYVRKHFPKPEEAKTEFQRKEFKQVELWLGM